MRILWIAGNSAMYKNNTAYNGGGWIAALQEALLQNRHPQEDITLAVSFLWKEDFQEVQDECHYYGIKKIIKPTFFYKKKEQEVLIRLDCIIKDFKPDVIHVFGTEEVYGLVTTITQIPVVIHVQGILSAVKEAWLPQNVSWYDIFKKQPKKFLEYRNLKRFIIREKEIIASSRYFMGRTEWDQSIISFLSPTSEYFYCSEMLRPVIYNSKMIWQPHERTKKIIVSVISSPLYKGGDVILRTAALLEEMGILDYEWKVYGISEQHFIEQKYHLDAKACHVKYCGIVNAEQLVKALVDGDIFVHPSYIENSPNTVCEAQLLGIPVIATNVGGTSSIIQHNVDGILVPANDIYMMASQLKIILDDPHTAVNLGFNGRQKALERHSPKNIIADLKKIYATIINETKN